jgi:hypothetical protein
VRGLGWEGEFCCWVGMCCPGITEQGFRWLTGFVWVAWVVGEARWWLGFGECVVDEAGLARAVVLSWVEEGGGAKACCFLVFSISLP